MNQFSDQKQNTYVSPCMCDDDVKVPNICKHSIDNVDVVHTYGNSTQITDEFSKTGLSNPTQTMSINTPIVQEDGAAYIRMDNYISMLSIDELSENYHCKNLPVNEENNW